MGPQFLVRGVKYHDLTDACRHYLAVAAGERPQVQIAHRASREPPELQVDKAVRVWDAHRCPGDRGELAGWDGCADGESHAALPL
jgi:hypothetical protein